MPERLDSVRRLADLVAWPTSLDDEHDRYALYRSILHAPHLRLTLLSCLHTDPDPAMATSVLADLLEVVEPWERDVVVLVAPATDHGFVMSRARELHLLERLTGAASGSDESVVSEEALDFLLAGSDWLQRRAAASAVAPTVLSALAGHGRTRKVRARAAERLRSPASGP